jgi:uncharacterized protein (TIGR02246 family)
LSLDRNEIAEWVQTYERAWRTAGTEHLSDLFTHDATYLPSPFAAQMEGLAAIAKFWDEEREGPDEVFTLESEIVAVDGDTGVVRLEVAYGAPHNMVYRDIWIVQLDEHGRCFHFEEWPFWPEKGATP